MDQFQKELVATALEMGADEARIFSMADICFDSRTLLKCFFGCRGGYHFCPTPQDMSTSLTYAQMVKEYKWGLILRTDDLKKGQKITLALERKSFLAGYYFALGATECASCASCSFPTAPCRNKRDMRLPLYAFGIDVYKTVRGLGWELNVVQTREERGKNITAVFVE